MRTCLPPSEDPLSLLSGVRNVPVPSVAPEKVGPATAVPGCSQDTGGVGEGLCPLVGFPSTPPSPPLVHIDSQ